MLKITQERVHDLFWYDCGTGNLIWKITKSAKAYRGSVAGSVNSHGHVNVQVDKVMYAAHQLIYLWHHGHIPNEIDHEDRDKSNNRIQNLRPATSSQNKGNISLLRNNTTGYRGVSVNSRSGKFHAQIKINGKQTYIGRFELPEDAARAYNTEAKKHFGDFAYMNDV